MRDLIVEELSVGAPPERAAAARALIGMPGNIVQALVDLGFGPRDVLQACCAVTGVPPAPLAWLRDPKPPAVPAAVVGVCRRIGAVPLATQNGKLCIGYLDPEVATRSEEHGLPKHAPYLALPTDLQKAFSLLPAEDEDDIQTRVNPAQRRQPVVDPRPDRGPDRSAPTVAMSPVRTPSDDDDDALFDDAERTQQVSAVSSLRGVPARPMTKRPVTTPPARTAATSREGFAAPPTAPDDGATLVMPPVHLDKNGDRRDGLVPRVAEDVEERTASVTELPPLPSAPKPARRQQSGAVSEAETAAAARVHAAETSQVRSDAATAPAKRADAAANAPRAQAGKTSTASAESAASGAASSGERPGERLAPEDAATAKAALKRAPSLATPSHGTTKVGPVSGDAVVMSTQPSTTARAPAPPRARDMDPLRGDGAMMENIQPAETVLTAGPPRMPSEKKPAASASSGAPGAPTAPRPRVASSPSSSSSSGPVARAQPSQPSGSSAPSPGRPATASAGSSSSSSAGSSSAAGASRPAPSSSPAASKPAASKPAASKPAASKPAASKPAASKPAASKPAASKPAASKPAASKPAASKPAASKPAALASAASSANAAARGAEARATAAARPVRTDESDPSMDTQQQARAVLSQGDLEDDSSSVIDARAGAPIDTGDVEAIEGDIDDSQANANEPPDARLQDDSRDLGPLATQYQTPNGDAEPTGSDSGAFASAGSADQEQVQSHKTRLKRIAQIASIKRYKIDRILGRGGMATVYYAVDTKTGQPCALKLMEPHLADDAVFVERFKREIRASISLDHDNIVRVFDYGEEGGTYYMASEYVDGGTVASLLKGVERPLALAAVVPMMSQFLDGLQSAHAQGLTHRDLKPANLMLTTKGDIKIGDFGIAKAQTDTTLTKTGALFGTPAYMSPEQAQGQELDTRSDLFGVGIIFYELLAGYNPFAHENPSTTMFAIAKGVVRPLFDANPMVPTLIERVVHKLLERDKAKRYQTAGEARDDLRPLVDLLQQKYPSSVARVLANAEEALDDLQRQQAVLESERAAKLLERSPPEHAEAAFRFYKATLLDPNNYEAVNGLTQLRADYGFRFTRPDDKQLIELEASLEKKPDQPAVLRRLAEISATHRNLVDMAGFMKRYLRYMPTDTHVQHKLERIIGPDPLAPFTPLPVLLPNETGHYAANDEMMAASRAAGDEEVAPGIGGRPAASARGATKAGKNAPTPNTPAEPSNPRNKPAGDKGKGPPTAPGTEPVDAPRPDPRDSFEAIVFALRGIVEDTVRSLTGDQGIQAVKENLKERFSADGRGDLKEVVKGAFGKGKDVVADSLLKEEGRKQIKEAGTGFLRQHGRLAAAVFVFLLVMGGLTRACAYACSDHAPAEPDKPLEMRGQVIDDGTAPVEARADAKSDAKTGDANTGDAQTGDARTGDAKPPEEMALDAAKQAELEARLLADKPKETPVVDSLAQKQEDLKRRAKAEGDINKAIELYTGAIDVDPYAPGARDATLERARLQMANGNLDAAEDDLFRLKRRQDIDAIKAEIDTMLDDIKKARKAADTPPPPPE